RRVRRGEPARRGRARRARQVPGGEVRPGVGRRAARVGDAMTAPLGEALDAVAGLAREAGMPPQTARAEAAAIAAYSSRTSPGAQREWEQQTGDGGSFLAAAG